MTASIRAAAGLAVALIAGAAMAQPIDYRVETVASGLEHPWSLAFLPDGRMLVTERPGRLRLIDADGSLRAEPVQGVPEVHSGGQAGLFEVALAPDFEQSGTLLLSYACGTREQNNTCVARARFDGDRLRDVQTIFTAQPMKRGNAHYGGRIAFLPDGSFVLGLGDGFDFREQAQDPGNHIGTIVRLNLDGSYPEDNPFVGRADHAPEVFTYGHRNVQGVLYDAANQRLLAIEHGPRGGDELNVLEPGGNYGWPVVTFGLDYSGARITPFRSLSGFMPPAHHWSPSIAPAGMVIYRGTLFPEWDGDILVAALTQERGVHRMRISDGVVKREQLLLHDRDERVRDVRVGPDGSIFVLTDLAQDGRVLRLAPPGR
ncbi:MAG: PQQ-dependent sugar dehydrogenase [Xanthomonadaceae bacterium]|nr:PQQ-dependent sugar dehydrogenase [Xanthomonadaceae bacterium]